MMMNVYYQRNKRDERIHRLFRFPQEKLLLKSYIESLKAKNMIIELKVEHTRNHHKDEFISKNEIEVESMDQEYKSMFN